MEEHEPVLLKEVTRWLRPERGGLFVDCTVGLGGHSEAILAASPAACVIGIDRDAESLSLARQRLARYGGRFQGVNANFKEIATVLANEEITRSLPLAVQCATPAVQRTEPAGQPHSEAGATSPEISADTEAGDDRRSTGADIDGCLADLGISSLQVGSAERGFSFQHDAPLDMRMDRSRGRTAAELIREIDEDELADVIFKYGEEPGARKIARSIAREREREPIATTAQLAQIVVRALKTPGRWRIHPATRTFQALRIAVNEELEGLDQFISAAISHLRIGARLAIISFHSLEDRIVKNTFRLESGVCQCPPRLRRTRQEASGTTQDPSVTCSQCGARKRVTILTRKPEQAGDDEIQRNPRSRSAKLRVCERVAPA